MNKPNKKNRSTPYYRHHRNRVVKAKFKKMTNNWDKKDIDRMLEENPKYVSKLHKGAAYCSCNMCRYEQRMGIQKVKVKAKEDFYDKQIRDYLNGEEI